MHAQLRAYPAYGSAAKLLYPVFWWGKNNLYTPTSSRRPFAFFLATSANSPKRRPITQICSEKPKPENVSYVKLLYAVFWCKNADLYIIQSPFSPSPLSSARALYRSAAGLLYRTDFLLKQYCEGVVHYNTLAHQYLFVLQGEIKNPAKNSWQNYFTCIIY